jgi:hypothetical protein
MEWFAYEHMNGKLNLRRFFSWLDIKEAEDSPFVQNVYGPFDADTRDEALAIMNKHWGRND